MAYQDVRCRGEKGSNAEVKNQPLGEGGREGGVMEREREGGREGGGME